MFQRTPSYAWPAGNKPLDADLQVKVKEQYRDLRAEQRRNYGGVVGTSGAVAVPLPRDVAILEATPEERLAAVDELGWAACRAWSDVLRDLDANEAGAELYREMVRRVIDDPETADGLSPRQLPIGCKRPILHTDYYETFNLDHVHAGRPPPRWHRGDHAHRHPHRAGLLRARRDRVRHRVRRDDRRAVRIDIRGRDGVPLRDAWADGARTLLGVQTAGFPNFFTITGPGSPSVLANMVVCAEQHIELIGELLTYMREHGHTVVAPTLAAQDAWVEEVNRVATGTMYTAPTCNSWYLGDNIPGKVRVFLPWVAGLPSYIDHCDRIVAAGYEGFAFSRKVGRDRPAPGVRLRPVRRGHARRAPTRRGSSPASTARWRGASGTVASG